MLAGELAAHRQAKLRQRSGQPWRRHMGLMDKVKAQASQLAEQTKQAAEQGKAKLDQAQANRRGDQMLRQLGTLVFAERTGRGAADSQAKVDHAHQRHLGLRARERAQPHRRPGTSVRRTAAAEPVRRPGRHSAHSARSAPGWWLPGRRYRPGGRRVRVRPVVLPRPRLRITARRAHRVTATARSGQARYAASVLRAVVLRPHFAGWRATATFPQLPLSGRHPARPCGPGQVPLPGRWPAVTSR